MVLRPQARTGVGQLDKRERRAADSRNRLPQGRGKERSVTNKQLNTSEYFGGCVCFLLLLSGSEFAVVEEAVQKLP